MEKPSRDGLCLRVASCDILPNCVMLKLCWEGYCLLCASALEDACDKFADLVHTTGRVSPSVWSGLNQVARMEHQR